MFVYMYLIGLLIGLGLFALTYLFAKGITNGKRILAIIIIGVLLLLASLTVIGGFDGMPFAMLSLGTLTIAVILFLFGKSLFGKKMIYGIIILFVLSYSAFMYLNQVDYWIIKKTQYAYTNEFGSYIKEIQKDTTIQGYKVFSYGEGNKSIVLSLGEKMAGNNIEVLDVKEQGKTTIITIRSFYNQSNEKNPFIAIGLNRVQSEVVIMDTNGTLYERVK